MWKLLNLTGICTLILVVTLAIMTYLAIDSHPRIEREISITPEQIARAKDILDTHRYQVRPGTSATVRIQADDLDNALNYLAYHLAQGHAKVTMHDKSAQIQLSLPIPPGMITGYLNLQATLTEGKSFPELSSVSIGKIQIPDILAGQLTEKLLAWLQTASPDARAGLDAFRKLRFSRNEVAISYFWKGWGIDKASYSPVSLPFFDRQALDKLSHYHHFLNEQNRKRVSHTITLSEILTQIMQETVRHSPNGNVLEEFRAAILVTAFHVVQFPLRLVIPETADWPDPVRINVTLDGRNDLAMHFMASAVITAYSDTTLSNAIGLYKELEDSRSGSGFSFNDLMADRSGTRFAEKAMASQDSARRMRNIILAGIHDTDLIPHWSDLPEHMSETAFKARFGSTSSPRYHEMMDKIEQRVASLKWLRY
ncbi:MAG TPA: hypothetical protein PK667_11190 [Nitrosomonas europaea]|uniref:Uncharacterized protein n=1 Tax=Nitrosomonas europaea (strain ATCC 19718 / CIP 103999 / KCTC 2705 / NBRC 14298) TaxID=228410 RepID=Q82TP7_NITEU|nr:MULTISPECIES: hypothetical protein [Nitrosomonas]CAD85744.1 hypothetical protein NE1833 [Nitrosomonas europaea ATCC 19718]SDW87056.1 hypothetical protein SAMN05216310_14719 [Nitrosomonas europaea]SET40592.1 hypothetical protein SAMN05216309_14619 [Nitrosomonas europaea]SJZ95983.1 hypothetical protein SAMN02745113_02324 [Nitrosomonas europaea]HBF25554.1 hypothetical protein [Nitrosomonas sp.]